MRRKCSVRRIATGGGAFECFAAVASVVRALPHPSHDQTVVNKTASKNIGVFIYCTVDPVYYYRICKLFLWIITGCFTRSDRRFDAKIAIYYVYT